MATAPFPSPFFFPTTAPMYAPTSAVPPPPFCFGAPFHSPYHHPFPYTSFPYPAPPPGFVSGPAYPPPSTLAYDPNQPPPAPILEPPTTGDPATSSPAHHQIRASTTTSSPPNLPVASTTANLTERPTSLPTDSLRFPPPLPAGRPATALLHRQVPGAPLPNDVVHTSASRMQQNHAPVATDFFLDRLHSSSSAAPKDSIAPAPIFPTTAPTSKMQPDPAPLHKLQDSEFDAVQRHATDLFLDRLPSSPSTTARDSTAVLGRPPLDCLHASAFDRTPGADRMPHRRTHSQNRMATAAEEAELLAASQAQAEAEEEIRGRLPREVLNIHRQLDLQQSSVDSLQGDISKLTGIVEQIGLSLQGSRAETPSRSSVTEGNPSFRTPPQPNPNLSPIPEIHTPNSTPTPSSRPPQQHQAVQFGNLTRDQLPHPTFPPSPRNSPHLPPTSAAETSRAGATTGSPLFRPTSPTHLFGNFPSSQMQSVTSSVPAPMCLSSCTSSLPAATYKSTGSQPDFQHGDTSDYLAPQVFGEMPTPHSLHGTHAIAPGYWNHTYCHHTPIPSSCVQGGSTNLSEKNPDGMPQSYGFHNLHRQSVFLSDGSEHSYVTLPADYPTPLMSHSAVVNVAVEAPPSVAAQVACLTPGLFPKANNTADSESTFIGSRHQAMVVQDASNVFKEMPVYDVYEDDATAYRNCVHPKVGISVLDNEPTVLCVNKESANVFSDGATIFPSIHVPYLFVGGSIECSHKDKIELPSLSDSDLCCEHGKGQVHNHQWNMLLTERRDEWDPGASLPHISIKAQQPDQALRPAIHASTLVDNFEKHHGHENVATIAGSSATGFSGYKCLSFWIQNNIYVCWKSEIGLITYISWDPGVLSIIDDMMLDKYPVSHQVQFVQLKTEYFFLSSTACMYIAANGIISVLQNNSFIMQRTAHLSESKSTATLILTAPGSQSTCAAKQSSLLSHSGNSRTNHSVTKRFIHSIGAVTPRQIPGQRHLSEPSLPVVMLRNGSKFTNGQLAYMPQHTSISSVVCVRHTIIVRSGWFPSFDNRAKLQWDPGIDISSFYICPEMRAVKPFIWLLYQLFSDLQHQLQTSNKISVWDPGIVSLMDLMLGKTAMPTRVQISQTPFKLLNFIEQLLHLEHTRSQLMLQCTFWCTTQSAFLHLQYCCFPLYSELVKLLGCYFSKFSSTAVCKSTTTTTLCMRVVLCSGKIAQEEKDGAAWSQVLKIQLPMSKTSHIWDPGIESILFLYEGLHIMIQQVDYSAIHACDLVSALLPLMRITAYCPSNIKQGVQENYNAQHLVLSSQDCVKIREIDIIFMTFRPP